MSTARRFMRKRNDRKVQRREAHLLRVHAWQSLSLEEQLQSLNTRLGKGEGARKQRARIKAALQAKLEAKKVSKKEKVKKQTSKES